MDKGWVVREVACTSATGIWHCADKGFIAGKIWRASPRLHDIHVVLSPQPLLPFPTLKFLKCMRWNSMRDHVIRIIIVSFTEYLIIMNISMKYFM